MDKTDFEECVDAWIESEEYCSRCERTIRRSGDSYECKYCRWDYCEECMSEDLMCKYCYKKMLRTEIDEY